MRRLPFCALVLAALLIALALVYVPSCVGPLVETPAEWRHQRRQSVRAAIQTIEKLQDRHGDEPFGQWPEADRLLWRNACRILAEMDGRP